MKPSTQVLIENAIGKAKQVLKAKGKSVPISAYDTFDALVLHSTINTGELPAWNAAIGLRNRIVHEYMNLNLQRVLEWVRLRQYEFIVDF